VLKQQQQAPPQPQQQKQQLQPPQLPQKPQHQQTRKDASGSSQPNSVNPHIPSQMKSDAHVSPSVPNVAPLRPPAQPISGLPMSIPFHHQQPPVSLQFGGHGPQMQAQVVVPSSMQMSMGLSGGNAPQVLQQLYAPSIQHHQLQQQAMMHPGQGMGYVPSAAHQFPPQLGSIPLGMAPPYNQQPNKYVAPRKTVKITHPDTHEELKLDKRIESSGPRASPNLPSQSQPISSYTHHMGFYNQQSNSYNQSAIYFPPTTGVNQVPTGSSGPRFNYPFTQSGQAMTYVSPLVGPSVSGQSQISVKPYSGGLQTEKSGTHTVTISAPPSKSDEPKLRPAHDATQSKPKDNEVTYVFGTTISNKSNHESKAPSVTEKQPTVVSQSVPIQGAKPATTATTSPVANSVSPVSTADGKSKEAIQRTGSFKDNKKNAVKKESKNTSQLPKACYFLLASFYQTILGIMHVLHFSLDNIFASCFYLGSSDRGRF
jgi:translation initiation factor 4G